MRSHFLSKYDSDTHNAVIGKPREIGLRTSLCFCKEPRGSTIACTILVQTAKARKLPIVSVLLWKSLIMREGWATNAAVPECGR